MSQPTEVPLEISVEETQRLLADPAANVVLIDVREADEVAVCAIAGARHIPMQQIPDKLGELPQNKHLLIHCHHGGRSMLVTQFLRAKGYASVSNVAGGIDAWAQRLDPKMRRY